MDTVFLRELKVMGKHGVLERERRTEQEFLIDIAVECDTTQASRSDDLGDTVDYIWFMEIVERVVAGNSFYLIEKLAGAIAEEILADTRIQTVRITIRKPSVLKSGIPGIAIKRSRV